MNYIACDETGKPFSWARPISLKPDTETLTLLSRWLDWRYGPEGPQVMFVEGAKLLQDTKKYLEQHAHNTTPKAAV